MKFGLTLSLVIFMAATGAADPINFRVAPEGQQSMAMHWDGIEWAVVPTPTFEGIYL
jgi:hypothetical protein